MKDVKVGKSKGILDVKKPGTSIAMAARKHYEESYDKIVNTRAAVEEANRILLEA